MLKRLIGLQLFYSALLIGSPSDPQVMHGNVQIEQRGSQIIIKNSDKSIIHWESFDISPHEIVQFAQSHENSSVLNRVVGNQQSLIQGLLQSNGQVILLNPQGVIISKTGAIDTAQFVCSTLDIPNQDFFDGKAMHFMGDSNAAIVNQGTVRTHSGDVTFIAARVRNEGKIQAPKGSVNAGIGYDVYFQPNKTRKIYVKKRIAIDEDKLQEGFSNTGMISAIRSEINVDGNLYHLAMNLSGSIDIEPQKENEGLILYTAEDGTICIKDAQINASSGSTQGGKVKIVAQEIIAQNTHIDATGLTVGGEIVLGDPITQSVHIDTESKLLADGKQQGGNIFVWGREAVIEGMLSAKGYHAGTCMITSSSPRIEGHFDLLASGGNRGDIFIHCLAPIYIQDKEEGNSTRSALRISQLDHMLQKANVHIVSQKVKERQGVLEWEDHARFIEGQGDLFLDVEGTCTLKALVENAGGRISVTCEELILKEKEESSIHDVGLITHRFPLSVVAQKAIDISPSAEKGVYCLESDVFLELKSDRIHLSPSRGASVIVESKDLRIDAFSNASSDIFLCAEEGQIKLIGYDKLLLGAQKPFTQAHLYGKSGLALIEARGLLSCYVQDSLTLTSEKGQAKLLLTSQSASDGLISVGKSLKIKGGEKGFSSAGIEAYHGDLHILAKEIMLCGGESEQESSAFIQTHAGNLRIIGNSMLQGGRTFEGQSESFYQTRKGSIYHEGSLSLIGGKQGNSSAFVHAIGDHSTIQCHDGNVYLKAGSAGPNSRAFITTKGKHASVQLTGEGMCFLEALEGSLASCYIHTLDSGAIRIQKSLDVKLMASDIGSAYLETANGAIDISSGKEFILQAGQGNQASDAKLFANGPLSIYANTIQIGGGNYGRGNYDVSLQTQGDDHPIRIGAYQTTLQGGGAEQSTAYIQTMGNQSHIFIEGSLTLRGGQGEESVAEILTLGESNIVCQNKEGQGSALQLYGGDGLASFASISSVIGNIDCDVEQIALMGGNSHGNGDALITASGFLTMQCTQTIDLKGGSGLGSNQAIISTLENQNALALFCNQLNLTGGSGTQSQAVIRSEDLFADIFIQGGCRLTGGSGEIAFAEIATASGGNITIDATIAKGSVELFGGSRGRSFASIETPLFGDILIQTSGDIVLNVMTAHPDQHASMTSEGSLMLKSLDQSIYVNSHVPQPSLSAVEGLELEAMLGSVTMDGMSIAKIFDGEGAYITLKAGKDVSLLDSSSLITSTPRPVTIVTDMLYSTPFQYGMGHFYMDPGTSILTQGGEVRIYIPLMGHSKILGRLNNTYYDASRETMHCHFVYYPQRMLTSQPYVVYTKMSLTHTQSALHALNVQGAAVFYQMQTPHFFPPAIEAVFKTLSFKPNKSALMQISELIMLGEDEL